jgi:hypothetical protein
MENIKLQVIDVALTPLKEQIITHHIGSLLRLTNVPERAHIDVVIRRIPRALTSPIICIMVRLHTEDQTYYAVGMEHSFYRAVRAAERELRKTLSRTHVPDAATIEHWRQHAHERFFQQLFAG